MSRFDRFVLVFAFLHIVGSSVAIYDPTEITTKPPKRREPVLPWYLSGKDHVEPSEDTDVERSPKWRTNPDDPIPRKPLIVHSGNNNWSPWRKAPDSEIEQRTEISNDRQFDMHFDQDSQHSLEYDEFDQRENPIFPANPKDPADFSQTVDRSHLKDKKHYGEQKPEGNGDFYEGVPSDSTKPHKEKILVSSKPKSTVAKYDSQSGVQCPDFDSTGQFVYPPDCKFFVNCWKGRAFVQPCAPGTLFNPDTLECDFPHKVKCYGGELADFPSTSHLDSSGRREPLLTGSHFEREQIQTPRCPPHVTGLMPHPTDCTKFLQCANGGTTIMDCGPGTVFNPAVSVCDWPRNVRGCEDALKGNEETEHPLTPPNSHDHEDYHHRQPNYHSNQPVKKVSCPPDFTGLLPHPDTCFKFLQCDRGGTFVMDCGPGTAFNPAISVCDWPYNVPGCSQDKTTTPRSWPSRGPTHSPSSPGHYKPGIWQPGHNQQITTTSAPKTDWDTLRPTWKPSWKPNTWTTETPVFDHHHRYEESHGSDRYKENGQWKPSGSLDSDQTTRWPHDHHKHDGHHRYHPIYHPDGDRDTQPGPPYDHAHHQGSRNHDDTRPNENWPSHDHHYGHHYDHHQGRPHSIPDYSDESDESQQQTSESVFDHPGGQGHRFDHRPNHDSGLNQGNLPGNRRIGHEFSPSRHEYGRTGPGFPNTGFDQTPSPDGNIYIDRDYTLPVPQPTNSTRPIFPWNFGQNRTVLVWSGKNRTWSQPATPGGQGLNSGSWTGQQGQLPIAPQKRPWDQGPDADKRWESGSNIYQTTSDRDAEEKFNQWATKTNIFNQAKGQIRPGVKDTTQHSSSPSPIYVDINGTRGHFITKEIEVNQGHSKTRTFSPNALQTPNIPKDRGNIYIGPQSINNNGKPATGLQPPYYSPVNRSYASSSSGDLTGSESTGYHHVIIPSLQYQPREQPPSRSQTWNPPSQYPPVPGPNLEPPYYERPNFTLTNHGSQYPIPSPNLQPPYQEAPNFTWPNSGSQYPMPSPDVQPPYQEATNFTWPNSGSQYPMPSPDVQPPYYDPPNFDRWHPMPSINLEPPTYEPYNRTPTPTNFPNFNNVTDYYKPVPGTDLQPPYYEATGSQGSSNFTNSYRANNYNPIVPSSELEPPRYQPPSRSLSSPNATTPSIYLQPPDYEPNSTDLPSSHDQHPIRPTSVLQPPYFYPVNTTTVSPRFINLTTWSHHTPTTTQRVPDKHFILPAKKKILQTAQKPNRPVLLDPNVPTVSIEYNNNDSKRVDYAEAVDPDTETYDVDVLDNEKEVWKPVLVFENKTRTTTESSVIMKISKKKNDVDLFNIEEAPFEKEEPPFPVYYVPPVQPLDHSSKKSLFTPISGQVIRLRGGSGPHDGYVEVQGVNPGWGIVCDTRNSWTLKEAHIVCRQLGYVRGAEMAWQGRNNRNGVPTWIATNSVTCHGNETRFQSCKFNHDPQCRVERDAIGVRCVPNRVAHCRRDEIPYDGQCYHLADPESGLNHAEALDYCTRRGARLLDITSQSENDFISEFLLQKHSEVSSVMTSGVGFTTMNRTLWVWEDSSKAKFRFTKWWPGWMEDMKHPPFVGSRPLCIVMKRKFPCHERPDSICVADYFFWDSEDCATSMKGHSYICKRPYDDIGCIYGKGNQYMGKANVTASGKECLSWADEKVAHPLQVIVVNRDVIEKLKVHNYCRNPNSQKESRPWCFTGPSGQREHCDIPPCGNIGSKRSILTGQCKPQHFECLPGECIPSPWVCDGEEDCTNGADERACTSYLDLYQKYSKHKLEGYDVEKWLNTPLKTCALRCKEADFTCRSFAHKAVGNVCLLSDSNVGMTGSLKPNKEFDYYEMKDRRVNCEGMYVCGNRKCINQTQVCNGKNDCNDRTDETMCTVESLDYEIRLAGSNSSHEGRVEVKILGVWGQVCDDGFGMINADVICKELGFVLGALEVRSGGFYGNLDPPTRFMVDQLKCRGNETTLRECDFDGWGVHNCQPEEAVGVLCKTAVDTCPEGHWKCDNSPTCIPTAFICDEVVDCPDKSDESPSHCDAPFELRLANGSSPLQGRVEVRHHGVWGTVCDDDFSNATAAVICRSLGYGGIAKAKKNGFFGSGEGPIWLDEVFCHGNETQLHRCEHNHWGQHNCNHDEDAGVICTPGDVNHSELFWETVPDLPETSVNDLLPADCGKRFKDFNEDEDLIFAKVVHGSVAPKGTYPWQASIRVRGHSRSSHWCGAVVLSPLHVLTAAHCLEGYNKGTYFVRAGDYNTEIDEGTEVEANIEDYYIHEDFRKGHRMNNDIALVLLKGRGISLGKDVMPICLPSENTEYSPGLNCTISGFGSIETGKSTHSKDLRYGWVPLLDQSVCRAGHIYGDGAISDGMVCAGYLDEGVDTCDGDSGGPLACYHNGAFTLYGITSWGQHCGKANKPGVYVRVSYYRRWIDQKIRESLVGR